MKIFMIADDSPVIREVARRIISDLGFVVAEAEDGAHAQQLCAHQMPDAILIDWDMPGLSGLELVTWLGQQESADQLKIIFCTPEVMVPVMTKAKRAGAHGFLLKPFNRAIIAEKLVELGLIESVPTAA